MKHSKPDNILKFSFTGKIIFILILMSIVSVSGMIAANIIILRIRTLEFRHYVSNIARTQSKDESLALVMQFDIQKERYLKTITGKTELPSHSTDIDEIRKLRLAATAPPLPDTISFSPVEYGFLYVINAIRFIMQKPPLKNRITEDNSSSLSIAYYFERTHHYADAIDVYTHILTNRDLPPHIKPIVNLHLGYCYALSGKYDEAKNIFRTIIETHKGEEIALAAALLLQYMDFFSREIEKIEQTPDSIQKSEALLTLHAYEKAYQSLDKLQSSPQNKDNPNLKFYRARYLEETGLMKEAIRIYQELILAQPQSEIAKYANRRLFIISLNFNAQHSLRKLTEKNNILIRDPQFDAYKKAASLLEPSSLDSSSQSSNDELERLQEKDIIDIESQCKVFEPYINRKIESTSTKKTTPIYRNESVFTYDTRGRKIKELHYNSKGALDYYRIFTYTARGDLERIYHYQANGTLLYYNAYQYDKEGNRTAINTYDPLGNLLEYY